LFKGMDGLMMALSAWPQLRRLRREGRLDIIDAHFAYPDGYAATLLGGWLGVPATITLRGTEPRHARDPRLAGKMRRALQRARRVFAVSESLRQLVLGMGVPAEHVRVVGNGVDIQKFSPLPRAEARRALELPADAPVLVTVGALVERKGFHRVIELLPALRRRFPGLSYLIVGGSSPEGDMSENLRRQVRSLALDDAVHFLGPMRPERLSVPLSAADLFVLPTRNEGWANGLLEAMACGRPVVATDVGGNAEVLCMPSLGRIVPFGDATALQQAIEQALSTTWDATAIRAYAERNTWEQRVEILVDEFTRLHAGLGISGLATAEAGHG
jgi:glycosyltransferase involved in cell wall biosynthesis